MCWLRVMLFNILRLYFGTHILTLCVRKFVPSFSSVQSLSRVQLFVTSWTGACQASCLSLTPEACSNFYPSSKWCYPTISSSVVPFSSCLQSFPASECFPRSQFFTSDGQSFGVSASHQSLQWIFRTDFL